MIGKTNTGGAGGALTLGDVIYDEYLHPLTGSSYTNWSRTISIADEGFYYVRIGVMRAGTGATSGFEMSYPRAAVPDSINPGSASRGFRLVCTSTGDSSHVGFALFEGLLYFNTNTTITIQVPSAYNNYPYNDSYKNGLFIAKVKGTISDSIEIN